MSVCLRSRESDIIMVITIEQALYPLLLIFFVFGFGAYFFRKVYFSVFYGVTIWIFYVCLFYYLLVEFKGEDWLSETFSAVNILMSIFVIIISIIINIYHNKRFRIFIKRLVAVDNTLEKLGSPKMYHKLHTYVKRVLLGWLVFINLANINDTKWWWDEKAYMAFVIPYIANYYFHVNMFMDLLPVTLLWLVLYSKHMHLHLELCQIARELNKIFGIQMTIGMINCIICFFKHCYYIYMHVKADEPLTLFKWFDVQTWLFLYGIRLFCLNYACENVSVKANEMKTIIHQLTNFLKYTDVYNEIYQFTLQLMYHPLKFTGLGFFYFGNNILRRLIVSLITYVIILIQMATIPENIYKHFKKRTITISSR